ncbi:MAG: YkvA family protein [Burkholderiales bacterium]
MAAIGSWAKWAARAQLLKREAIALYIAARDPRTPIAAKLLVLAIVAYAVSPIDLIPDFIPVLGYLDELILLPIAISFAIKMIPDAVMVEARAKATNVSMHGKRIGFFAAALILIVWIVVLWMFGTWVHGLFAGP